MKKKQAKQRNHVAKYMEDFNKPKTFRDRTKYFRKGKQYASLFHFSLVL